MHLHGKRGPCLWLAEEKGLKGFTEGTHKFTLPNGGNILLRMHITSYVTPPIEYCTLKPEEERDSRLLIDWIDGVIEKMGPKDGYLLEDTRNCAEVESNASGDFVMLHRSTWEEVKGFR